MPPPVTSLLFSGWPVVFMMGMVSEMTEEEVVARIQELHLRMFRYAWSVLGNRQDAEDVLELAQTRIWKARNQCRDPEKFESWAFAILNNKIKDDFRKHKRRLEKESFVDKILLETLGDGSPDPERRLIQFELLQEALSSLNDKEKKAVLLRGKDGLSNSEIADQTEQRESSVRSQYSRGIRKIKKAIEGRKEPNSYAGK
jgi:RNA polymerase sigma-70 factor (ECF subfamily)